MMELVRTLIVFLKGLFGMVSEEKEMDLEKLVNKLQAIQLHNAINKNIQLSDCAKNVLNNVIDTIVYESDGYIDIAKCIIDQIEEFTNQGSFTIRYYKSKFRIPFTGKYVVSVYNGDTDIIRFRTSNKKKIDTTYIFNEYDIECNRIYEYSPYARGKFKPKHLYRKGNTLFGKNRYTLSRNGKLCIG